MAKLAKKVAERITAGLKRFQPILASAKSRDVNESDTVVIVTDVLQEIFGYDKYSEITSEHMIRGTFCDLAIKLDGQLALLVEVKAIGIDLKERHVKQAVDYASNQGTEWVGLTNGMVWRVYKVIFGKPIERELVVDLDLSQLNARNSNDVALLGLLAKEGWQKARLGEYHSQKKALSRFVLGALVLSDAVVNVIRREIKRMSPEVRVDADEIKAVLQDEVLKRDVLEGDKAASARKRVSRSASRALRRPKSGEQPDAARPALSQDDGGVSGA